MAFESIHDFWSMGGYALYVWLSFGVALSVIGANIIAARRIYQDTLLQLKAFYASEQADSTKDISPR